MAEILVQIRIELRLQDVVEHRLLALFLRLERLRIVEHFAVAVAQDIGRVPALDADQPRLEAGRDDRLDQRLPRLQILARQRRPGLRRQVDERRNVGGQIRRRVRVRDALADRRVGVHHARRNRRIVLLERALEVLDRLRARGDSVAKISVLPHQTITSRSRLLSALNFRMSATTCSARSFLFLPFLTFGPSSRFTYR